MFSGAFFISYTTLRDNFFHEIIGRMLGTSHVAHARRCDPCIAYAKSPRDTTNVPGDKIILTRFLFAPMNAIEMDTSRE